MIVISPEPGTGYSGVSFGSCGEPASNRLNPVHDARRCRRLLRQAAMMILEAVDRRCYLTTDDGLEPVKIVLRRQRPFDPVAVLERITAALHLPRVNPHSDVHDGQYCTTKMQHPDNEMQDVRSCLQGGRPRSSASAASLNVAVRALNETPFNA